MIDLQPPTLDKLGFIDCVIQLNCLALGLQAFFVYLLRSACNFRGDLDQYLGQLTYSLVHFVALQLSRLLNFAFAVRLWVTKPAKVP